MAREQYIFETNTINGGFLVDRRTNQIVGTTANGVDQYFVTGDRNPVTGGIEIPGILPSKKFDVCIYGATPSGVMAAVAASRCGSTVALIEPTAWVGGMVTGGVSHTDVSETQNKACVVGLADEFYRRIANEWYGISQNGFWVNSYNAEPSVSAIYIKKYLDESGVTVVTSSPLKSLVKSGAQLLSADFTRIVVGARTWIDATYEGDLAAAAGCSFSVGREANALYSETHNGVTSIGAGSYQFPAAVDPYVTAGVPASGLLPFVSPGALATAGSADGRCQALCLRLTVTTNGGNKVVFPDPDTYSAGDYELLGRAITAGLSLSVFGDMFAHTGLRGTSKYDVNNKACMSVDYVHPTECTEWVTASWERRAQIAANVKNYTLGLIKFLKTDSRVPAGFKTNISSYGLCADEYGDYANITPQVYVREGRRLVGDYVMDEGDMILANGVTNPIAYGYYMNDSHTVQNVVVSGAVKAEGPNAFSPPIGYPVSYNVLLPKAAECTNLMATNAMSTSRVVFGSLRMEPVLMALGQAAGIAASIAASRGMDLASVPYAEISAIQDIKGVGSRAIVLDVSGTYTRGIYTETGTLSDSTSIFGYVGTKFRVGTSANSSTMKFAPNIIQPGQYGVYVRGGVASAVDATRTPDAQISIVGADGTKNLTFSQKSASASGDWDYYGDAYFNAGTPSANYVLINCVGSTLNTVVSAVKFVPRGQF